MDGPTPAIGGENYCVRCRTKDGGEFVAELGPGYGPETRMQRYLEGIIVTHPGKPAVYINATTRQVSKNAEVCRSSLIVNPGSLDLSRTVDQRKIGVMDKVLGPLRR